MLNTINDARLEFHEHLIVIMGSKDVWFQPGSNITLKYPCILYEIQDNDVTHASNKIYKHMRCYKVTVIDRNPSSKLPDKVLFGFPYCEYVNTYIADQLYHNVYNVYFKT